MTEHHPSDSGWSLPPAPSDKVIVELDDDPHIGKVLNNRYRIDSRLGVGGYGVVYRGTYLEHRVPVAIKMLRPAEDHNQEVRARFRREGEALGSLKSQHTVRTYEFGYSEDGSMYIAMELLEGHTLKDETRRLGCLTWRRTLTIIAQICEALTEAHAIGYVHRDLKPENIFLADQPDGTDMVKVLDFGIVKKLQLQGHQQDGDTQLTAHGQTVGTMRYMSPEQLLGQPVDSRSDIYSLGVLLHRMLTGRVPFPKAKNMARLIAAQLQQTPQAPSLAYPDIEIPVDVDKLVLCMLEKTPHTRLPNTEILRLACCDILETGQWSGADRFLHKGGAPAGDDATAPADAVDPSALMGYLGAEAQASLAQLTGQPDIAHDVTERQPATPPPMDQPMIAAPVMGGPMGAPHGYTPTAPGSGFHGHYPPPQHAVDMDIDLDALTSQSGSGLWMLIVLIVVLLAICGAVVFMLI